MVFLSHSFLLFIYLLLLLFLDIGFELGFSSFTLGSSWMARKSVNFIYIYIYREREMGSSYT